MAFVNSTNLLVQAMSPGDRAAMAVDMERVDLPVQYRMGIPHTPPTHVYFIDEGVASVVAADGEKEVEIGIFGLDGVSSAYTILGVDQGPFDSFMQIGGFGWRIEVAAFTAVLASRPMLGALMLRYMQATLIQTAYSVRTAAVERLDVRLARWLLMCHDRVDGDELLITHHFISMMLGTRRAGVTESIHVLEGERMIAADRGRIVVRDRAALERRAGASYGVPEAEYARLIGQTLRHVPCPVGHGPAAMA